MYFSAGAYWDVGTRNINEDSVLLQIVDLKRKSLAIAAVADGIVGLGEGHVASGYLLERLNEAFYSDIIPLAERNKVPVYLKRSMLRTFYLITDSLRRYGDSKNIKLGTTLTCMLFYGKRYLLYHIGDSRAYRIRNGNFISLSTDHIKEKGELSRCLGSFPYMEMEFVSGKIRNNTGFLICSDGFYSLMDKGSYLLDPTYMQSDQEIERNLMKMGKIIRNRGQKDNASAVYITTQKKRKE